MRAVIVAAFALVWLSGVMEADSGQAPRDDKAKLIATLTGRLPNGWKLVYSEQGSLIEIKREHEVMGVPVTINGPPESPQLHQYEIAIVIVPFVSLAKYKTLSDENAASGKKIDAIKDQLRRSPTAREIMDDFESNNTEDLKKIEEYQQLEKKIHTLPNFYFKNLGLIEEPQTVGPSEPPVEQECETVRKKIEVALSTY